MDLDLCVCQPHRVVDRGGQPRDAVAVDVDADEEGQGVGEVGHGLLWPTSPVTGDQIDEEADKCKQTQKHDNAAEVANSGFGLLDFRLYLFHHSID